MQRFIYKTINHIAVYNDGREKWNDLKQGID